MTLEEFLKLDNPETYDFKEEIVKFKDGDDEIDRYVVYQAIGIAEYPPDFAYDEAKGIRDQYVPEDVKKTGHADNSSLTRDIYEVLWQDIYEVCPNGDTMNSCSTTLDELFKLHKEKEKVKKLGTNENGSWKWSKRKSIVLYDDKDGEKIFKDIIKSYKGAREFLKVSDTIGNFIPVPSVFNCSRADGHKAQDYWDITLFGVWKWFMSGSKESRNDFFLHEIIGVMPPRYCDEEENVKASKEWLLEYFDDWDDFVEKNYLQDFVNEGEGEDTYGKPKELWDGHFDGSVKPKKIKADSEEGSLKQFTDFFKNASAWILARGNRMLEELRKCQQQ